MNTTNSTENHVENIGQFTTSKKLEFQEWQINEILFYEQSLAKFISSI